MVHTDLRFKKHNGIDVRQRIFRGGFLRAVFIFRQFLVLAVKFGAGEEPAFTPGAGNPHRWLLAPLLEHLLLVLPGSVGGILEKMIEGLQGAESMRRPGDGHCDITNLGSPNFTIVLF